MDPRHQHVPAKGAVCGWHRVIVSRKSHVPSWHCELRTGLLLSSPVLLSSMRQHKDRACGSPAQLCGESLEQAWLNTSLRTPLTRRRRSREGRVDFRGAGHPKVPALCAAFPSWGLRSPWGPGRGAQSNSCSLVQGIQFPLKARQASLTPETHFQWFFYNSVGLPFFL